MKFVINGWFYVNEQATGIDRYGQEIIRALDKIVKPNQMILLVPTYVEVPYKLNNIKVVREGKLSPFLWQQLTLTKFMFKHRDYQCLSLTNTLPVLLMSGVVVVHDISPIVNKTFYSKSFRRKTNWQTRLMMWKPKVKLITVSKFSASEISRVFGKKEEDIDVVSNGWNHMDDIKENNSFFYEHPEINKGNYLFAMSSMSPNKNFDWVYNVAKINNEFQFVIAGKIDEKIFGKCETGNISNVVLLGYISDSDAKTLLTNAKAFIFPSFYEGFGIPPLEAMSCGTKIIVSDIPCLREVYGNTAYYIDPNNWQIKIQDILQENIFDNHKLLEQYTWENAAKKMAQCLELEIV